MYYVKSTASSPAFCIVCLTFNNNAVLHGSNVEI